MENQQKEESIDVQKELQKIIQEREKFRIQMTRKYYLEEVIPAKENGKKVIYTGGGGFGELVYAFDNTVLAIRSDNYAVYTAARRQHRKYLDLVEAKGLSPDVCSYDRVAAGLMYTGEGVYGKMPEPDLIIGSSSVCETHAKFWEIVSDHYGGTPFFPFYHPIMQTNERMPEYAVEYGKRQVRKALEFIAEHTGQKVDWDRFKEVVKTSVEALTYYWENVIELRTVSPSPGFDDANYERHLLFGGLSGDGRKPSSTLNWSPKRSNSESNTRSVSIPMKNSVSSTPKFRPGFG